MTVRPMPKCQKCGRVCSRGYSRCKQHKHQGRPRKYAEALRMKPLKLSAWAVAQTALDDDAFARQWEQEQGR